MQKLLPTLALVAMICACSSDSGLSAETDVEGQVTSTACGPDSPCATGYQCTETGCAETPDTDTSDADANAAAQGRENDIDAGEQSDISSSETADIDLDEVLEDTLEATIHDTGEGPGPESPDVGAEEDVEDASVELDADMPQADTPCMPQCEAKACGDDGCGDVCGTCGPDEKCTPSGQCKCAADCANKQCGDDGCGNTCGQCKANETCDLSGQCMCVPECGDKVCGDNGCDGSCGQCEGVQEACNDISQCEFVPCAADADCQNGPVCTVGTCQPDGNCDFVATAHQVSCGDGLACFEGVCEQALAIAGVVTDGYLYPIQGVSITVEDGAEGTVSTDAAGWFIIYTKLSGQIIVNYKKYGAGQDISYGHEQLAVDANLHKELNVTASGGLILKEVAAKTRFQSPASLPDLLFGGLSIRGVAGTRFIDSAGSNYEGTVEFTMVYVDPLGLYRFYLPDASRAITQSEESVSLTPLGFFELRAFAVSEDGSVGGELSLQAGSAFLLGWHLNMGDGLYGGFRDRCGGDAWAQVPVWHRQEDTATWLEATTELSTPGGGFGDYPENQAAVRTLPGDTCLIQSQISGELGWWAVAHPDASEGWLMGKIIMEGNPAYGSRVVIWDEVGGGLLGSAIVRADGKFCAPVGDTEWVTLRARHIVNDALEVGSGWEMNNIKNKGPDPSCGGESGVSKAGNLKMSESCLQGYVKDAAANPVAGALVTSSSGTQTHTDDNGHYCLAIAGERDVVLEAVGADGQAFKPLAATWMFPGQCPECFTMPDFEAVECDEDSDCVGVGLPISDELTDIEMGCHVELGDDGGTCRLRIVDESSLFQDLQRIYYGANIQYRRQNRLDQSGNPLPCQFPANQSVTPVEQSCCSSGGLGGADMNLNDHCDPNPDIWTTPTWSALGFGRVSEHRYLYEFLPGDAADTFDIRLHMDGNCDGVYQTLTLGSVANGSESCALSSPETISYTSNTYPMGESQAGISTTEEVPVSFTQKLAFTKAPPSLNHYHAEFELALSYMWPMVEDYYATQCQFPPAQGLTPIEQTCCSDNGLGGPDIDGDNLCDSNIDLWSGGAWEAIGFETNSTHHLVYGMEEVPSPDGGEPMWSIYAHGDLDCDAVQSTFRAFARVKEDADPGACALEVIDGLYTEFENE